jgi:hypothetical protein
MKNPRSSKSSPRIAATNVCLEALEARRLMTNWTWSAMAIHQDTAAIDYPKISGVGQAVAVLDTGAYQFNPALAGKTIIFKDFIQASATTVDTVGHGTGVASQIAGNGYNDLNAGAYLQGVAPGAQLIVLRTDDQSNLTPWVTQAQRISNALDWVIANRAKYNITAVNLSTGDNQGFTDTALTGDQNSAIDQQLSGKFAALTASGVFIAAASGNDGGTMPNTVEFPAADPNVYSVGSTNISNEVSQFTSGGALNDFLAPGESVTLPYYFPATPPITSTQASGTSFAVTQVVGAALLIKQVLPNFKPAQIAQILQQTGTTINDPFTGHNFPLINIDAALKLAYTHANNNLGNHDAAHATVVPISGGLGSISNQKLIAGLPNFYSFSLAQSQNVTLTPIFGAGDSATAQLLNQQGSAISTLSTSGTTNTLAAGTYYVSFLSPTALANTFGLGIAASNATIPSDTPAGGNAVAAKIAYDPYGRLDLAWYDGTSKNLKFAQRNANGTWNGSLIIDSSPQAGAQLSIAVDPYGLPGIAYYDQGRGQLKYAHFNGTGWTVQVVDSSGVTGWQPSLVYTNGATPYIAYFMASGLRLKVATPKSGTKWSIATVDSGGNVGFVPSLAYDKNTGQLGVAYEDLGRSWYKYAALTGGQWRVQVVDTHTNAAGGAISLAFDSNDRPQMVYNDAYTLALKYAFNNGSTWTVEQVNGTGVGFGQDANLGFDAGGFADIYYYNYYSGDIEHANHAGGIWSNTHITAGGSLLDEATTPTHRTLSWIVNSGAAIGDLS